MLTIKLQVNYLINDPRDRLNNILTFQFYTRGQSNLVFKLVGTVLFSKTLLPTINIFAK